MKKKYLFIALLSSFLLFSCGSNEYSDSDVVEPEAGEVDTDSTLKSSSDIVQETTRKVVYTVNYYLTVDVLGDSISSVSSKVFEFEGYTESMSQSDDDTASYVYRVPTTKLDTFVDWIDSSFEVGSKEISSKDITSTYNETEARLEVLNASRKAYVNMLSEPNLSIADIIQINNKLEEIDTELTYLNNQKASYDNKIAYSTVKIKFSSYKYVEPKWYDDYFENIGYIFKGLFIAFMYTLPFALIGGGITAAIVVPKVIKKKKNKQK